MLLHWLEVEDHMMGRQQDPRTLSCRQLLTVGWALLTAGRERWQVELLLAEVASRDGAHTAAVGRLAALQASGGYPKSERSRVRRALFYARLRSKGRAVPGD